MGIDESHTYFEKKLDYIRNNEIEINNSPESSLSVIKNPKSIIVQPTPPNPNGGIVTISIFFPVSSLCNIFN